MGTPREVMRAMEIVQSLAQRVGRVDLRAGFVPREIRRQQWSFLKIPLMWAASSGDSSCAVLQWLADSAQNVSISVGGDSMSGRDAVMAAWDALHAAMRAWGIRSREGLSEWVQAQGFPQPRWGAHFSGRAQECLLNAAANHDVRVSALETAYVQVTLQACEQGVRELDQNLLQRRTIDAPALPAQSWEALDPINLAEVFQIRFPVLQSCPFQFRGRYRHAARTAL